MSRTFLAAKLVLAIAAIGAVLLTPSLEPNTAIAQEDSIPHQPVDLAIDFPHGDGDNDIEGVVTNNSGVRINDVKVRIDVPPGLSIINPPSGTSFASGVLTIQSIAAGREVRFTISPYNIADTSRPARYFLTRAWIESSSPKETPGLEYNNRAEIWTYFLVRAISGFQDVGDTSMAVRVEVDDLRPALNGQPVFTVAAMNRAQDAGFGFNFDKDDVQVKITLSPGMSFADRNMADTTISGDTATWRVGDLPGVDDATRTRALSVPVNLSGSAPLETRCLTAEVDRVKPPDPEHRRFDDAATVCLGDHPTELIDRGEVGLFKYVPCIGVTDYPCNTADTLEIVTEVNLFGPVPAPKQRRNDVDITADHGVPGRMYLQPESVIIQVKDPQGRHEGKWRTATTSAHSSHYSRLHDIPGAGLLMNFVSSGYNQYTFELSDVEPKQRPGALTLLSGSTASNTFLDVDTRASIGPFNFGTSTTSRPSPLVAEFSTLGLHKVQVTLVLQSRLW